MDRNFSSDVALGFVSPSRTDSNKHAEKKYSALHKNWLPHIVSIVNPKSPVSLDYDTYKLYAVYNLAAISLSLGFELHF